MESKCHNRQNRMSSHIFGGKGRAPAKNGAQAVFQAHVRVDKFFFAMNQDHQADQPVKAAADKKDKCHPGQRTAHKIV
jgi:hypothetical protein